MKRHARALAIYATAAAAVVLMVGAYFVEVQRPVHRVIDSVRVADADHRSIFPPLDDRCYKVHNKTELYDLLREEHGWSGTINPEKVGENPVYPMTVGRMFYPPVLATSRFHHYSIYANEIQQISNLTRVVEMWHDMEIADGGHGAWYGAGFKHVIWSGTMQRREDATIPVCYYIYGPGLPKGPPAPPPAFVDQTSTTTNATSTGQ